MLTEIEKRYVARGYQLPPGLTWPVVHAHREMLSIEPWLVPIEVAPGLSWWSVPAAHPAQSIR